MSKLCPPAVAIAAMAALLPVAGCGSVPIDPGAMLRAAADSARSSGVTTVRDIGESDSLTAQQEPHAAAITRFVDRCGLLARMYLDGLYAEINVYRPDQVQAAREHYAELERRGTGRHAVNGDYILYIPGDPPAAERYLRDFRAAAFPS